ncbi:MAG: hypothetical protein FJ096_18030 [Deltaproteobacteria bacterium]|nr:hypothetical protein [Deltaproteobacteria bacterium]
MVTGETDQSGARTLRGHTFQLPRLVENAFPVASMYVGSSVEFFQQAGVTATLPSPTGGTQSTTFDREITFVKLNYGVDFSPSRYFSFGLEADYLAEVGANGNTLFTWGGSGSFDFRPNLKIRLLRSERTGSQLAVRGSGSFQRGIRAMPLGLLVNISNQLQEATATPESTAEFAACLREANISCLETSGDDITATRQRNAGGGTLAFAQALGRYAGFQLAFGVEGGGATVTLPEGSGQKTTLESTETVVHFGISPSLNFNPKLPVGLTVEYRFERNGSTYDPNASLGIAAETSVAAVSHRVNGGLYYTGRRDLMLGWLAGAHFNRDVVRSMQNVNTDPRAFVFAAQFDMRYFF